MQRAERQGAEKMALVSNTCRSHFISPLQDGLLPLRQVMINQLPHLRPLLEDCLLLDEEQGIEQGLPSGARMVAAEATTQTRGGTLL